MFNLAAGAKRTGAERSGADAGLPANSTPVFFLGLFKGGLKILSQPPISTQSRSPFSVDADKHA
jgi:hypothetical protein